MTENKTIEIAVELPAETDWDELAQLEDEMSEACGEILKEHGLKRLAHTRRVEADYTAERDGGE